MSSAHASERDVIYDAISASYNDPALFARVLLGVAQLREWQAEVCEKIKAHLESGETNTKVLIRTCRGGGKTFFMAVILLWWMVTRYNARGLTTAPTWAQVKKALWPEIEKLYNRSAMRDAKFGRVLETELDFGETWFAVGHSSDNPANLEGHHSDTAAIRCVDEGKEVPDQVYDYTAGMLTSPQNFDLWISTPSLPTGRFAERDMGEDTSVIRRTVTIDELLADKTLSDGERKGLQDFRTEIARNGEDDPLFRSQGMAEYVEDIGMTLFPISWIERAIRRQPTAIETVKLRNADPVAGMDVAGSVAGDESAVGVVRDCPQLLSVDRLESWQERDTMKSKGRAVRIAGDANAVLRVDYQGLGQGVGDAARESGARVEKYRAGNKPHDERSFLNRKAEDAWNLRGRFERDEVSLAGLSSTMQQRLKAQLKAMTYKITSASKRQVIDPADSPDLADAILIASSARRPGIVGQRHISISGR